MNTSVINQYSQVSPKMVVRIDWASVTFFPEDGPQIDLVKGICQEIFGCNRSAQ
ncbi:MAG: hypothetical protein HQL99_11615 [Magnetococcales bacterium]|nr:hypothetical protein [Magnetococcales bacterium]